MKQRLNLWVASVPIPEFLKADCNNPYRLKIKLFPSIGLWPSTWPICASTATLRFRYAMKNATAMLCEFLKGICVWPFCQCNILPAVRADYIMDNAIIYTCRWIGFSMPFVWLVGATVMYTLRLAYNSTFHTIWRMHFLNKSLFIMQYKYFLPLSFKYPLETSP